MKTNLVTSVISVLHYILGNLSGGTILSLDFFQWDLDQKSTVSNFRLLLRIFKIMFRFYLNSIKINFLILINTIEIYFYIDLMYFECKTI